MQQPRAFWFHKLFPGWLLKAQSNTECFFIRSLLGESWWFRVDHSQRPEWGLTLGFWWFTWGLNWLLFWLVWGGEVVGEVHIFFLWVWGQREVQVWAVFIRWYFCGLLFLSLLLKCWGIQLYLRPSLLNWKLKL